MTAFSLMPSNSVQAKGETAARATSTAVQTERSPSNAGAAAMRARLQSGAGIGALMTRFPAAQGGVNRNPMFTVPEQAIGDGRSPVMQAWAQARHNATIARTVDAFPELTSEADALLARLSPTNPAQVRDFGGENLLMGEKLSLTGKDGIEKVLVPSEMVPEGRRIIDFDLSRDGRFVAFGTGGTGDDRIWQVLDLATHKPVLAEPIRFNSFGNGAKFAGDSKGIYYPGADPDRKVSPTLMYQSLEHVDTDKEESEPIVAYRGESVLPPFPVALDESRTLAIQNLTIGNSPGFPLYTSQLTKNVQEGSVSFNASAGKLLSGGQIGRVVSAETDSVIYQTASTKGRYALVDIDPATAAQRLIVPPKHNETMHVAQRVGDRLLTWYLSDDQKWTMRCFDLDGKLLKEIKPSELGMPAWCSPSLSFSGDTNSKEFTDFVVSAKLKSPRTYRLDLKTLELTPRVTGNEVDIDPSKVKEVHGTFKASDGTSIPYHMWIPKNVPADHPKMAIAEAYGSIGIVLSRGWNLYDQLMLSLGFAVAEVGVRGGGEFGAQWRDAGATDRNLTVSDQNDFGRFLESQGYAVRVDKGRSWGGWRTENGAVADPGAFTHRFSIVSAGDAARLIAVILEEWALHDFGALMARNGGVEASAHALQQAWDTSTPYLLRSLQQPVPISFVVQKDDDRAEPGSPMRSMWTIEQKYGQNHPNYDFLYLDGGHGARADRRYWPAMLQRQLGDIPLEFRSMLKE